MASASSNVERKRLLLNKSEGLSFEHGHRRQIAPTSHSFDVLLAARWIGELLAQLADEHVDDPGKDSAQGSGNVLHQRKALRERNFLVHKCNE